MDDGRLSINSSSSHTKISARFQKYQIMNKKLLEDKFKEFLLYQQSNELRLQKVDEEFKSVHLKIDKYHKDIDKTVKYVKDMKKSFDLLTNHRKYYDALLAKSLRYTDKLKD